MAKKEREPKEIKFYEHNELVNFRLTRERTDIRAFLNHLRLENQDISKFLEQAIREKAGLPTPLKPDEVNNPTEPVVYTKPVAEQPQFTPEMLEIITNQILAKIQAQGIAVAPVASNGEGEPQIEPVSEQVNEAVKKAVSDALDWE